jgi:LMBR1 domain-containing protein 1
MKVLYYIFYCVLIAFAFFILPFLYFFYEEQTDEEEPTSSCASRCCTAFKYMIVFIIAFGVILTLAFVLKKDKADQSVRLADLLS